MNNDDNGFSGSNVVPISHVDNPEDQRDLHELSPIQRQCLKCHQDFTPNQASGDPRYCQNCGHDFTVTDEIKKTIVEDYDEFRDILNKHTQKFRQVTLQGEFWKFNTQAIHTLNDASLSAWIEFHRGMVVLLEQEATERKVKQIQVSINCPVPTTTQRKITQTTVKKTTRIKRDPMATALASLGNLTPEQIAQLLSKLGGK